MIAAIIILTLLVAILFAITGFLLSHWFFKPKNNPNRARIYVDGIDRPYEANLAYQSQNGACYTFQKGNTFVFVPASYKIEYHYYKRTIYLDRLGNLVAIPKGEDRPLTSNAKDELIKELVQSHIGAEAVKAIKGPSTFGMTIIFIIIGVLVIGGAIGFAIGNRSTQLKKASQSVPAIQQPGTPTILPPIQ